jgi:hypothetical protein
MRRNAFALRALLVVGCVVACAAGSVAAQEPTPDVATLVKTVDDRLTNPGDLKWLTQWEERQPGKDPRPFEVVVYRRDADDSLGILFLKPKTEAGKGYLRLEKNLFLYDPATGKWERRTVRERLGGTDAQQDDIDNTRFAQDFDAAYVAAEKLGDFAVHHVRLAAKRGVEVPFPRIDLFIDAAEGNLLKRVDQAEDGRPLRTVYFRDWRKYESASKAASVFLPEEIRIVDEIVKGARTVILSKKVSLEPLPGNLFTKAWVEGKSR